MSTAVERGWGEALPPVFSESDWQRFTAKFTTPVVGCWEWTASSAKAGYGQLAMRDAGPIQAHRLMFLLTYGSLRRGDRVTHECDNRLCVRPSHLRRGNAVSNMAEAIARGQVIKGEKAPQAKLSDAQIAEIRASTETGAVLGRRHGICPQYANAIKRGVVR